MDGLRPHLCQNQGQTLNPGLCPDQEPNRRPFALWDNDQPTEPHQSGPPCLPIGSFKTFTSSLAGVAQLVGASSHHRRIAGSIPDQGTHLGCRFSPLVKVPTTPGGAFWGAAGQASLSPFLSSSSSKKDNGPPGED